MCISSKIWPFDNQGVGFCRVRVSLGARRRITGPLHAFYRHHLPTALGGFPTQGELSGGFHCRIMRGQSQSSVLQTARRQLYN